MSSAIPAGYEASPTLDGNFGQSLGPLFRRLDGGGYAFRVGPEHRNGRGMTHGGVLMTIADQTLGLTVQQALDGGPAVTVTLNCDFVDGAQAGELIEVDAVVTRVTRSLVFVKGELTSEGRTILTAAGIWKRMRPIAS